MEVEKKRISVFIFWKTDIRFFPIPEQVIEHFKNPSREMRLKENLFTPWQSRVLSIVFYFNLSNNI